MAIIHYDLNRETPLELVEGDKLRDQNFLAAGVYRIPVQQSKKGLKRQSIPRCLSSSFKGKLTPNGNG